MQDIVDREYVVYEETIPPREASFVDFLLSMRGELADCLRGIGIQRLYAHQAEAFERASAGENFVVTTATASGKTLCFFLPVIQAILEDPQTRAIFIYPTKALAADQYRALEPFLEYFGPARLDAGVLDGDTPMVERSRIRNRANIIMTNPDMMNIGFLPHHSDGGYAFMFSHLKFVVVDEAHAFRGVFGAHVANLFRRLRRICAYHGSDPRFLFSSATIANPAEHAAALSGIACTHISQDGSPSLEKRYCVIEPPMKAFQRVAPHEFVYQNLTSQLVKNGDSSIVFSLSRVNLEIMLRETKLRLENDALDNLVTGYRGGYTALERRKIEQGLASGAYKCVIATNALELGIDIGHLDTAVLAGFPGTRASFWQQAGRAGRGNMAGKVFLVLGDRAVDQYIASHPEWLFSSESESAVVDPNNLFVQKAHLRAAAAELPLTIGDMEYFKNMGEILPVLLQAGEMRLERGKFVWCSPSFPASELSMRGIDRRRFRAEDEFGNFVTEVDEPTAYRELYKGAIYMHDCDTYLVKELNLEDGIARLERSNGTYYTEVNSHLTIAPIAAPRQSLSLQNAKVHFGDVRVTMGFGTYDKIELGSGQHLGRQSINPPLVSTIETEGFWVELPDRTQNVLGQLNGELRRSGSNYFGSIARVIAGTANILTMSTPSDVSGGVVWGTVFPCVFDWLPGGMGFSFAAFRGLERLLDVSIDRVLNCRCKSGCPACTGAEYLDKQVIAWALRTLREDIEPPATVSMILKEALYYDTPPYHPTSIDDISRISIERALQDWDTTVARACQRKISGADALKVFEPGQFDGRVLTLVAPNKFIAQWASEPNNSSNIQSAILACVEVPVNLAIRIVSKTESGGLSTDVAKRLKMLHGE